MNRLSRIFRSLGFRVALLTLVILALGMGLLWSSRTRRTAQPPPARRATAANPTQHTLPTKTVTQGYNRPIDHFTAPPPPPAGGSSSGPPPLSESVRKTLVGEPGPISLFPNAAAPPPAPPAALPPTRYLPSFRLIRCMLITAPQTGEIETPLIGVVLENQYNIDADGRSQLVIPAGIEVHAIGRPTPVRDRIDGDSDWTFVWRTADPDNATELRVPALALNRDFDATHGSYGDQEKSPGILGRRFESFSETVIKEALLDAAAATIRSLKSTTTQTNSLTNTTSYVPKPGLHNAALEGAAAGTDRVTKMLDDIRTQIEQKGYYVAVLPGKEFYLYNKVPIDLRLARRPGPLSAGSTPTSAAALLPAGLPGLPEPKT